MIVVGDASVFIALQRVGEMPLLNRVFGEVHVPDAVWREVFAETGTGRDLVAPAWVVRHPVRHSKDPQLAALDPGEAAAILLAHEIGADLLLIDEAAGRRVATSRGLKVTGVVGILIEARHRGEIQSLRQTLERLRTAGFWLGDSVIEAAIGLAGER